MTGNKAIVSALVIAAILFAVVSRRSKVATEAPSPTNSSRVGSSTTVQRVPSFDDSFAAIAAETDPLRRSDAIEAWLSQIADEDIRSALESLIAAGDSPINGELRSRLLRLWAELDLKGAADWAVKLASGSHRQAALNDVAIFWANKNLPDAVGWARSLPQEERNNAFVKIAYEAVESEPMQALQLAHELPATEARDELVTHTAANWGGKDPKAASEWALQIQDKSLREQALSGIATSWSEDDPKSAAEMALKSIEPGRPQNDAVVGIVQRWAQKDAENAGAWVAQFPEGALRNTAAEELVKQWAEQNSNKAAEWLDALEPGRTRDRAIGAFVGTIAADDPQQAATLAGKIGEEHQRNLELERIAEAWLLRDPAGARAWLNGSGLPESVRKKFSGEK